MPPRPPRSRVSPVRRSRVAGKARTIAPSDGPAHPPALTDDPLADRADAPTPDPDDARSGAPSAGNGPDENLRNGTTRPGDTSPPSASSGTAPAAPAPAPAGKDRGSPEGSTARPRPTGTEVIGDPQGAPDGPEGSDRAEPGGVARKGAVALLVAALVLLLGAAGFFGVRDAQLRSTPAALNSALVDVGGTAEAADQLSDAVETVYSFDFARLEANKEAAHEVITPAFAAEFDRLFAQVQKRAPKLQAVVSATVTAGAVKELTADRAVLVAFVDQQATRAAPDAEAQQLAAAGRLTVTGERVDGRWKIAAVTPL